MKKSILILSLICFTNTALWSEDPQAELKAKKPQAEKICSPNGCYALLAVLGNGAFGKVYKAMYKNGQIVAIKSYLNNFYDPDGIIALLGDAKHEFQMGQVLNHPNIVKTIELIESKDNLRNEKFYLVMEFVNGKPVFTIRERTMSPEASKKAIGQFLSGIKHAKTLGLHHIDLHGGNLMVEDKTSNFKIIDLASFITFEEYIEVYHKATQYKSEDYTATQLRAIGVPAKKEMKIRQFIENQVQLKAFGTNGYEAPPSLEEMKESFSFHYFWQVSQMTKTLLELSQLDPRVKEAIIEQIDAIGIEYQQNYYEKNYDLPFDHYIESLEAVIRSI